MSPGIDEVAAFDKFLQYMHSREYDIIVFDTAPTGHALRFLSLPDVLDSWVGKMIKIRMKLSGFIDMFKKFLPFAEEGGGTKFGTEQLEEMKKRIEEAKKILTEPKKTHFWLVSIPEQMSIFESERAQKMLESYGIKVEGLIVNQIVPKNKCEFCRARREMQEENIKRIEKIFKGFKIKKVPLFKHEVKGAEALEKLGELIWE
jgi:arsenite-transporting ATPase